MSFLKNETDSKAWHWALLERDGPLSSEELFALQVWLAADPRHEGALIRARAACLYLARLSALGRGRPEATPDAPVSSMRRKVIGGALAAGALLGMSAWIERSWNNQSSRGVSYASEIGQTRRVVLGNGSELLLNTATEVIIKYSGTQREAVLTRGEAIFAIAGNALRPFSLLIGEWLLRAADAIIAVRLAPRDQILAELTVTKGMAELGPLHSGSNRKLRRLDANQEAIIVTDGIVEVRTVTDEETKRHLAWRAGMIVFEGATLMKAVLEMNRYSRRQLVVVDPELSERRIVGVFRASDTDAFVSQLQSSWGVQADVNGNIVLLRSSPASH